MSEVRASIDAATAYLREQTDFQPEVGIILVAGDDRIVPAASSRRLVEAFALGSARVATIAGAGHNSLSEKDEYYRQLSDFLAR